VATISGALVLPSRDPDYFCQQIAGPAQLDAIVL
jgi:hypothetical protein